ncbi:hypothetical protein AOLI_G00095690 [Acnodon oligacanthus]
MANPKRAMRFLKRLAWMYSSLCVMAVADSLPQCNEGILRVYQFPPDGSLSFPLSQSTPEENSGVEHD